MLDNLSILLEDKAAVDIVTFTESPEYLNQTLYPRQRLILKLYYHLELSAYPCWCTRKKTDPNPDCNLCLGTGTYDELLDVKRLLRADQKYAKLYFPSLCEHHVTGSCQKEICHDERHIEDYVILSDTDLVRRLKAHSAHILTVIAGRRGSKSLLGAAINAYSLYILLRESDPHHYWEIARVPIGTANVATDEVQALILFNQLKALMDNSPWFQRLRYRSLESTVEFTGRQILARSFHSNSASVRGHTLMAVFLDEFCHFNKTSGRQSDTAMRAAIFPSVVTFKKAKRIVITSSPLNKAGVAYEQFEAAVERKSEAVIAFQLATWEMNPTVPYDDGEIQNAFKLNPDYAEMEYGAQWAESVGIYIPPEAVDACLTEAHQRQTHGNPKFKYVLHIDLSAKRDRSGLVITHYDPTVGKVIIDQADVFDPKQAYFGNGSWVNELGEIDHQKVFEHITRLTKQYHFNFRWISFDQFNSQWLLQTLRKFYRDIKGEWIQQVFINDPTNREVYGNLRSLFVNAGIAGYPHPLLMRELKVLSQTVKQSGAFKIEAPPGETDDLADALAVSAYYAYALSLGYHTSITVLKETEAEAAKRLEDEEFAGYSHKKTCKPGYCAWGCPVERRRLEVRLGVAHTKDCTATYCTWDCPVNAALIAAKEA